MKAVLNMSVCVQLVSLFNEKLKDWNFEDSGFQDSLIFDTCINFSYSQLLSIVLTQTARLDTF